MQRTLRLSQWIFIGILAYVPLHILLSTWLGTSLGVLPIAKVAKDIVMVWGLAMVTVVYMTRYNWRKLLRDRPFCFIGFYAALTIMLAMLKPTDPDAEIIGIVFNLRFLAFFVYGFLLSRLVDASSLRAQALKAVLLSGFVVLTFGVFQYLLLPDDALTHLGYARENGVLPAFFIDDKPDFERIMSTQRDPNSLGSYILIILGLSGALWMRGKRYQQFATGFLGLSVLCLWFTFSRSAWIGAVITLAVLGVLSSKKLKPTHLKRAGAITVVVFGLALLLLIPLRDSYLVQNVIFHADESTVLEDPNELRLRFYRESAEDVISNPLGSGPGTAGLASIRNDAQGVRLNENYYLQIATEVGIVGLAVFLAILTVVAYRLWLLSRRGDWLATALLASFAGLAFTNLLVHIWATEAVAYTWWGLAGVVLAGPDILDKHTKRSKKNA